MYRNLLLSCFSAALFSLLLINSAQAQYRGSLQGTVTDPAGAVIPGADVTLTNRETNQSMHAQTGDSGAYAFNSLPPSSYTLVVEKSGFKRKQLDNVSLIAEQANSANVQLDIGDAGQTITVNGAEAPLIDTETAIISGTVDAQQIQKMPSFGRDVFQLVQLAPGAFGDASQSAGGGSSNLPNQAGPGGSSATSGIFQTENKPQVVANGSPMESNNITIDGVGVTSISWGGSAVVTPNEESVKEVKVVTNNYDAEYGRYSGAQIQVISKNGTNDFHGSLFLRAHRPGLNAYQRWNGPNSIWTPTNQTPQQRGLQRDEARFNQLGGSVGGPIWKNKIFGFFSIEAVKNNSTNFGTGWYETPQFDALAGATVASQFLAFPGEGASFSSILPATCSSIGLTEGTNCATTGQGLDVGSPLSSAPGTQDPGFTNAGSPGVGGGLDGVADFMDVTTVNPTTNTERQ